MKTVIFEWPAGPGETYGADFFVGVWHPRHELSAEWRTPKALADFASITGRNWSMIGSSVTVQSERRTLVHRVQDGSATDVEGLAFRGYVVDPPTTSWSSSDAILDYWRQPPNRSHNGVFAAVRVCRDERSLELVCDALGIAPLYYRKLGDAVCFASSARFLRAASDSMDRLAARSVIQMGYVTGDRALSSQVRRVPAGSVVRMDLDGVSCRRWFDFSALTQGFSARKIPRLSELEDALQASVRKCARLSSGPAVLPLSSGYDSRRILSALQSQSVPFEAITVRVLQKGDRDLDGRYSTEMAKAFGFCHRTIELEAPRQHANDDVIRRYLVDGESVHHAWTVSLVRQFPERPSIFFDGLAGDVLGAVGFFGQPSVYSHAGRAQLEAIATAFVDNSLAGVLLPGYWPTAQDLRDDIVDFAGNLP
ncbi:MAG: asparagine synthase-related protein, partial [Planctomycetota bacterium]|nr:asparagine synthase-related protein [Planctomycetota bacterium]